MTLTQLRAAVRRDLRDEDPAGYRWSDGELDRHIDHALRELSQAIPREAEITLPTTDGSREVDLSSLTDLVMLESVEYPLGQSPPEYRRFEVWGGTLVLLDGDLPDGSDCGLRYGTLHTLDEEGSTVPARFENLVAVGAEGHALLAWGAFTVNRISLGGEQTSATAARRPMLSCTASPELARGPLPTIRDRWDTPPPFRHHFPPSHLNGTIFIAK